MQVERICEVSLRAEGNQKLRAICRDKIVMQANVLSSNGRTLGFGPSYLGSNPGETAIKIKENLMVVVGLSWLVAWILLVVFNVTLEHTLLATGLIFTILGLLLGERPWKK